MVLKYERDFEKRSLGEVFINVIRECFISSITYITLCQSHLNDHYVIINSRTAEAPLLMEKHYDMPVPDLKVMVAQNRFWMFDKYSFSVVNKLYLISSYGILRVLLCVARASV